MREVLDEAHVDVHLKIYKGRNHTDAVFEVGKGRGEKKVKEIEKGK